MKYLLYVIALFLLYISIADQTPLDGKLEQKFVKEIEDEKKDDRPQELKKLEKKLEDEGNKFVNNGLQEFKTMTNNHSINNTGASSSTSNPEESISKSIYKDQFEHFKFYTESIRGLNQRLMNQLKEVYNKLKSFYTEIEPEKEIIDIEGPIDIIPIMSNVMTCRLKVVNAVNWIGLRILYIKNNGDWMSLRQQLVNLKDSYKAMEMNLNEYLTSINRMILDSDSNDIIEVRKAIDYFKETTEESKYISMTQDIISRIEELDMKPRTTDIMESIDEEGNNEFPLDISTTNDLNERQQILNYYNDFEQEMITIIRGRDRNINEQFINPNILSEIGDELRTLRRDIESRNLLELEMIINRMRRLLIRIQMRINGSNDLDPLNRFINRVNRIRSQE